MSHLNFVLFVALCTIGCAEKSTSGASISNSGALVTLDGVDFMGGDLKHLKTTGGPAQCAQACEKEAKCNAYTYAKPDHPKAKKHHSCWLKKAGFKYKKSGHYVSGIKP